jgi:hypothetical protein
MSDEKFKLPQSSYEELSKVIKAYGHLFEPKPLDEISKFIGLNRTIISGNAGFLVGVGILEPGAKKVPTANGRKLAHALEHNMPDEIRTWWRQIVSGNDFLTRLLAAIRIRSGMDQQTLEAHIAYSAGQPKKPQFMTGARTVIDILRAAELIKEVDGKYMADYAQSALAEPTAATDIQSAPNLDAAMQRPAETVVSSALATVQSGLSVRIQININCTPAEMPSLGIHLKKLMEELSSPEPDSVTDEKTDE